MKPSRLDVQIVTGATWTLDVQLVTPGAPVAVAAMTPGGRYYIGGEPVRVHSVRDLGNGWCAVATGTGLYDEPELTLASAGRVAPADPVEALEAAAGFSYAAPGAAVEDPPTMDVMEIPATISADGETVTLSLDADETAALADSIGSYSWDLYVRTAEWEWRRVVEGTLTIMAGDAR